MPFAESTTIASRSSAVVGSSSTRLAIGDIQYTLPLSDPSYCGRHSTDSTYPRATFQCSSSGAVGPSISGG